LPIWLLFGTGVLQLSVTTTTVLFMLLWILSGLLEIPTGALADRLGRKKMYLIGVSLFSLYPLAYALELPLVMIALVSVVSAFGSALRSGTLVALTHESYKQAKRSDKSYHAFLSNELLAAFMARAISGVAGGMLYALDPHAPYVAMAVAYVCMFIAGLFVVDTATERSKLSNRMHISQTIRQLASSQLVIVLISVFVAVHLVSEAIWTAFQPFFANDGLSPQVIGSLFSCIAIVSAAGVLAVRYAMRKFGVILIEIFVMGLIVVTALLLYAPSTSLHLLAVVPAAFAFGMTITPIKATVQKHVSRQFHSTALSVVSVMQYLVYGVASLYVSLLIDHVGVYDTKKILCIEALVAMALVVGLYIWKRRQDVVVTSQD
jgi:MFS family permease